MNFHWYTPLVIGAAVIICVALNLRGFRYINEWVVCRDDSAGRKGAICIGLSVMAALVGGFLGARI